MEEDDLSEQLGVWMREIQTGKIVNGLNCEEFIDNTELNGEPMASLQDSCDPTEGRGCEDVACSSKALLV